MKIMPGRPGLNTVLVLAIAVILVIHAVLLTRLFVSRNNSAREHKPASAREVFSMPVTMFTAKVEKVASDLVLVSYTFLPSDGTATNKKAMFTLRVNESTVIKEQDALVPYSFRAGDNRPTQGKRLRLSELSPGDVVLITTETDLQQLEGSEFTAKSIQVSPYKIVTGRITAAANSQVTILGSEQASGDQKIYQAAITPESEIVAMPPFAQLAIKQVKPSDIAAGANVTAYISRADPAKQAALLILQIMPDPKNVVPPPAATRSALTASDASFTTSASTPSAN